MGKIKVQALQQAHNPHHQRQFHQCLDNQINAMGHTMDLNKRKGTNVMNLFCNTTFCAIKNINTICPKENELLGNQISWQAPTNC